MTLDGLERAILNAVPKRGAKINVIRYADDFIVTAKDRETLEEIVRPAIEHHLAPRGLLLSATKTTVTHIRHGLVFLGQTLRKLGDKLLITPAKASVKALLEKIRRLIRSHRGATAQSLISKLNPVIRGWAHYHRHIAAKATFARVDHAIHWTLMRWARRRHPTKATGWLVKKYFPTGYGHFSAPVPARDGKQRRLQLYRAAATRIERHIKVRAEANPYDPHYTDYFERRRVFAWRVMTPAAKVAGQPATQPARPIARPQ